MSAQAIASPRITNPSGRLKAGCYAICLTLDQAYDTEPDVTDYQGTLRVDHRGEDGRPIPIEEAGNGTVGPFILASGDLYAANRHEFSKSLKEIPIYPRDRYRFYLWVTDVQVESAAADGFTLQMESHSFDRSTKEWKSEGTFSANMKWIDPVEGALPLAECLEGRVSDSRGLEIGTLTAVRVSEFLRRAVVEIDSVGDVAKPLGAEGRTWQSVFERVGWQMTPRPNDTVAEPAGKRPWSVDEIVGAMLTLRDSRELDQEWQYYIFCVGLVDGFGRGFSFDWQGGDVDYLETVAIAGNWRFDQSEVWGETKNKPFQETPLFFRTAIHEIGHCMNLDHNTSSNGFMNTTDVIALNGRNHEDPAGKRAVIDVLTKNAGYTEAEAEEIYGKKRDERSAFPNNVDWAFANEDQDRLRHWPDVTVRPGTPGGLVRLPEVTASFFRPDSVDGAIPPAAEVAPPAPSDIELSVAALLPEVPCGAPVRINLKLINLSAKDRIVPSLDMRSGSLSGEVVGPGAELRSFQSLVFPVDTTSVAIPVVATANVKNGGTNTDRTESPLSFNLHPQETKDGSITLLRGPDGSLFPTAGRYAIKVNVTWYEDGRLVMVSGQGEVQITPTADGHEKTVRRVLETPDTLLCLAFSENYLAEGNQAVNEALTDSVLGRHFAIIRLKRWLRRLEEDPANLMRVAHCLGQGGDEAPVLSKPEIQRLAEMVNDAAARRTIGEGLPGIGKMITLGAVDVPEVEKTAAMIREKATWKEIQEMVNFINNLPNQTRQDIDRITKMIERLIGVDRVKAVAFVNFLVMANFSRAELGIISGTLFAASSSGPSSSELAEVFHRKALNLERLTRIVGRLLDAGISRELIDKAKEAIVEATQAAADRAIVKGQLDKATQSSDAEAAIRSEMEKAFIESMPILRPVLISLGLSLKRSEQVTRNALAKDHESVRFVKDWLKSEALLPGRSSPTESVPVIARKLEAIEKADLKSVADRLKSVAGLSAMEIGKIARKIVQQGIAVAEKDASLRRQKLENKFREAGVKLPK